MVVVGIDRVDQRAARRRPGRGSPGGRPGSTGGRVRRVDQVAVDRPAASPASRDATAGRHRPGSRSPATRPVCVSRVPWFVTNEPSCAAMSAGASTRRPTASRGRTGCCRRRSTSGSCRRRRRRSACPRRPRRPRRVQRVAERRGVFGLVADAGQVGHATHRDDVVAADDRHVGESPGLAAWIGARTPVIWAATAFAAATLHGLASQRHRRRSNARVGVHRDHRRDDAERRLRLEVRRRGPPGCSRRLSSAAWPYVATSRLWLVRKTVLAPAGIDRDRAGRAVVFGNVRGGQLASAFGVVTRARRRYGRLPWRRCGRTRRSRSCRRPGDSRHRGDRADALRVGPGMLRDRQGRHRRPGPVSGYCVAIVETELAQGLARRSSVAAWPTPSPGSSTSWPGSCSLTTGRASGDVAAPDGPYRTRSASRGRFVRSTRSGCPRARPAARTSRCRRGS